VIGRHLKIEVYIDFRQIFTQFCPEFWALFRIFVHNLRPNRVPCWYEDEKLRSDDCNKNFEEIIFND